MKDDRDGYMSFSHQVAIVLSGPARAYVIDDKPLLHTLQTASSWEDLTPDEVVRFRKFLSIRE